LSDADIAHFNISVQDRSDLLEEVNTEISVYLGMLYHLIEVFKGHEDFAEELSEPAAIFILNLASLTVLPVSLDPPLPVYLFNVVSGLRDKSAKGYPVKKVRLTRFSKSSLLSSTKAFARVVEDTPQLLRWCTGA
jgi:hypothetical protein